MFIKSPLFHWCIAYIFVMFFLLVFREVHAQGTFFGVTAAGGTDGVGTIFTMATDGSSFEKLHDFTTPAPGGSSNGIKGLIQAKDGKLYGVNSAGGSAAKGILFEYDPVTNAYAVKVEFTGDNGKFPVDKLCEALDGKLYGVTISGGRYNLGVLFEFDPAAGLLTKRFDFGSNGGIDGYALNGGLIVDENGKLWGMAAGGGGNGSGVLFQYDPNHRTYTKKADFNIATGSYPSGRLTLTPSGNFFGVMANGGDYGYGTLFMYDSTTNEISKKIDFSGITNGASPNSGMVVASNGKLYGMTGSGGDNNDGVLFEYDPALEILQKKIDFLKTTTGSMPTAELLQASNGKLYGTLFLGAANNFGALFEYTISTNELNDVVLCDGSTMGGLPTSTLLQASNGKLYGADGMGLALTGSIFEYDVDAKAYNTKITLNLSPDGSGPIALTQAPNKKLYGVTNNGGLYQNGVLFEFDPYSKIYTKKVDFSPSESYSSSPLTLFTDGKLYGVHPYGPSNQPGLIFSYDPITSSYVSLLNLPNGWGNAVGGLTLGPSGKMYGATHFGGQRGKGLLYEYDPVTNSVSLLVNFDGSDAGEQPGTSLLYDNGKLYGLCPMDEASNNGTLFEYDIANRVLSGKVWFNGPNGAGPYGNLVKGGNGKLYGTTYQGGSNNYGVLFEFDPATGIYSDKIDIPATTAIGELYGCMALSPNGKLYGLSSMGNFMNGIVFEYDITLNKLIKKMDFTGKDGRVITPNYFSLVLIEPDNQSITFDPLPTKTFGDQSFSLDATASSGLPVVYMSSNPDVASINGNTVTINGAGTTQITASQNGSDDFNAAQAVEQQLVVKKATQTITFPALPVMKPTDTPFAIQATSSSELEVTYSSSKTSVAFVSGNVVTIEAAGTTIITASQTGNNNYNAATDISRELVVTLVTATENPLNSFLPYPNPANRELTIDLSATSYTRPEFVLFYNTTGQVLEVPVDAIGTTGVYRCSVGELTTGLYLLKLPGSAITKTIMIIH